MKRLIGSILVVAVATAIVGVGFATLMTATATRAEAARCICPLIYAPVICDKGRIYPNPCVADCRHAKNCVPLGIL